MGNCLSPENSGKRIGNMGNTCKRDAIHTIDPHRVSGPTGYGVNLDGFGDKISPRAVSNRSAFSGLSNPNNYKGEANSNSSANVSGGVNLKGANSNESGIARTSSHHYPHAASGAGVNSVGISNNQQVVIALYNYNAKDEGDLSFRKGDRLVILDDGDPDWWLAKHKGTNHKGYIPRNYVVSEAIETEE